MAWQLSHRTLEYLLFAVHPRGIAFNPENCHSGVLILTGDSDAD